MIIICNGAFKSGSTWLYLIVEELLKQKNIPINENVNLDFISEKNDTFLFQDSTLKQAINFYQNSDGFYLTKTHLLDEESYNFLSKNQLGTKILFIKRNLGDAIVSHYHHVITETEKQITFNKYYKLIGRFKAKEIVTFEENKIKYFQNSLIVKFEDLKSDFNNQVILIANELGFEITEKEIEIIKEKTSLKTLKEKAKKGILTHYSKSSEKASKLFRRGKVGEAEDNLTEDQKNDLDKIANGKTSLLFNLYYTILFKWRRKIYKM